MSNNTKITSTNELKHRDNDFSVFEEFYWLKTKY